MNNNRVSMQFHACKRQTWLRVSACSWKVLFHQSSDKIYIRRYSTYIWLLFSLIHFVVWNVSPFQYLIQSNVKSSLVWIKLVLPVSFSVIFVLRTKQKGQFVFIPWITNAKQRQGKNWFCSQIWLSVRGRILYVHLNFTLL